MKLKRTSSLFLSGYLAFAGCLSLSGLVSAQQEVGFLEKFALAESRAEALKQLIPGTEDYYYYHALHFQTERNTAELERIMGEWVARFRSSSQRKIIENREALIRYSDDPAATLAYLKRELGVTLNHQQEGKVREAKHPSVLDPKLISWDSYLKDALGGTNAVENVQLAGLYRFLEGKPALGVKQRRHILATLVTPDAPGLVNLVLAELQRKTSRGFGEFGIHRALTKVQLDALMKARPSLKNEKKFVDAYLLRLLPGPDENMSSSAEVREAYLDRAEAFVSTLGPTFTSLKAHLRLQRLIHDQALGKENQKRFMEYLALPRNVSYTNPDWRKSSPDIWRNPANLGEDFRPVTTFPSAAANEEALVKSYILKFLKDARDSSQYAPYLRDSWLREVFSEAKITHGIGKPSDWAALLSPARFQALKDRVDIEFDPTSTEVYGIKDDVVLPVHLKNVPKLMVKVFEINTVNFYRKQSREVSTDIDLDGLVANTGEVLEYDRAPQLRTLEKIAIKGIPKRRGIWVVELIGGGKSSRAVIRKGALGVLSKTTSKGHLVTVLDENNAPVKGASLWLEGSHYDCDAQGRAMLPFTNNPGIKSAVLEDGKGFATMARLEQSAEKYTFLAGFHVEQEALRTGGQAKVMVRPSLSLAGEPVSLSQLEDVSLEFQSVNLEGTPVRMTVRDLKLASDREFVHEFRVPDRLTKLTVTLRAKVKVASQGGKEIVLTSSESFAVNETEKGNTVADLFLSRMDGKYRVELLGRNGEPMVGRNVNVNLSHPHFRNQKTFTLKTTDRGAIDLGALDGLSQLVVSADGARRSWSLDEEDRDQVSVLALKAGEVLKVPFNGKLNRREVALFSSSPRSGYLSDEYARLKLQNGYLTAELPSGDYRLFLKQEGQEISVMVAEGQEALGHVFNEARRVELTKRTPSHIKTVKVGKKSLEIEVAGLDPLTRVHLMATRFVPGFDPFAVLGGSERRMPTAAQARFLPSLYISGRKLGDELRYILERRYATKFAGNMLTRPEILLNPWAVRDTQSGQEMLEEGDRFARKPVPAPSAMLNRMAKRKSGKAGQSAIGSSSYEFLAEAPLMVANLVPEKNGKLTVDLAAFGDRQHIHVLLVDPDGSTYRAVSLGNRRTMVRDRRLMDKALDAKRHFTEQDRVSFLKKGEDLKIPDLLSAKFEVYDDLAGVYRYYLTLNNNPVLRKFGFVANWNSLPIAEKKAKYSEFVCHELSFFLSRKDPAFFNEVIIPHLANKKDRTFMDDYLLGRPLERYFEPYEFDRLNVVERILLSEKDEARWDALKMDLAHRLALQKKNPADSGRWFSTGVGGGGFGGTLAGKINTRFRATNGVAPPGAPAMELGLEAESAVRGKPRRQAESREELKRAVRELEEKSKEMMDSKDDAFAAPDPFAADVDGLDAAPQLYRALEPTKEWAENNYYQLPITSQNYQLVTANAFWLDLATHGTGAGFGSGNLGAASRNFTEIMFALSFLDLPFESPKHKDDVKEGALSFTAGGNVLFFHREVRESGFAEERPPLLVSQSFYQLNDRYRMKDGQKVDKFITSEFIKGVVYGSQIVVTNPTSSTRQLDVLSQVPKGAIPVSGGQNTSTFVVPLNPYSTHRIETAFYFPKEGEFPVYPAHLSKAGEVVAHAEGMTMKVVLEPSTVDKTSWNWISQWGEEKDVLEYLKTANLHALDLGKMAWRCRESADFFRKALNTLQIRGIYNQTIQGYAVAHNDKTALRDYLMMQQGFLNQCGVALDCELVTMEPINRRRFEHLEYRPLINNRAHALGGENRILNPVVRGQYLSFLRVLSQQKALNDADHLGVAYYLFLQDRVEEALAHLGKVRPQALQTRMQFDYFQAYAAFYQEDLGKARQLARKYEKYPVDRWRERFEALMGQIKEIEGANPAIVEDGNREQEQEAVASQEPAIEIEVKGNKVHLAHENLDKVTVNYYEMDLEFLFSTNPFVSSGSSRFDIIQPNKSVEMPLAKGRTASVFNLPKEYQASNVIVEITGGGKRASKAVYANELRTMLSESMGLLTVRHGKTGRPLSKVYVKVYAETDSDGPVFFKDGYTDLRGKFDYASVSTQGLGRVRRFSILVMSEENGATVLEASVPRR